MSAQVATNLPDVVAFIEAQLAEDEAAARAATPGRWAVGGFPGAEYLPCDFVHAPDCKPEGFCEGQHVGDASVADGGMGPWALSVRGSGFPRANAKHVARWDPPRVLAEIEAKRLLLTEHARIWIRHPWVDGPGGQRAPQDVPQCRVCIPNQMDVSFGKTVWPCLTLKILAAPYAAHPDYDIAWSVTAERERG